MKKSLWILGLALLVPLVNMEQAKAYSSAVGVDPFQSDNGTGNAGLGDYETKQIVKSSTASASEALVARLIVAYDTTAVDGYTVTRAVTQTVPGQQLLACITTDAVATSDTTYHRCITKGFARVKYDAATPIEIGRPVCANAGGIARGCILGGPNAAEATANTGIISLESKASGTGDYLRVLVNLK